MNTQLTITLAGEDHPQLINVLAAKTHALGGKWLISKINRLDNQVVGIIKIDIPADAVSDLKHAFLEQHALDIRVIDTPSQAEIMPTHPVTLKVEANDRPGLVHDLSRILDDIGIGIVNIENRRIGVPDLGKTLFFAEFQLNVSEEIDLEQLTEAMQQVDDGLLVKIVEPA
ncbi:glycine cleavage system protein R [Photobacterium aphoticum]|uniref:Glycine cleavage system transcriptional repressor n=1 Tax=Photobacterium aphoticum TaxID=754436 RepID=A0A0J1GJU8_9GAMM|nr:ACT domain-containing protein [Photobacterium aphoticum]KLV00018.1 glycine cleavage system regulatory protein [Photobacterium aphoticum]PSU58555.1 transcriptional regulator [Photobacterium aphoticum]GHA48174.1 transcriptional regulator [Photobacterium aphoticum]